MAKQPPMILPIEPADDPRLERLPAENLERWRKYLFALDECRENAVAYLRTKGVDAQLLMDPRKLS